MPLVLGGDGERVGRDVACYGRFGESLVTNGEWTLFIWPQPEHFALLALATAAPVRALQAERLFREEQPFPVSCARGEMKTQLFKVSKDPQQLATGPPIIRRS